MQNDFPTRPPVTVPDRAVDYRAERQRAGIDVVRAPRQVVERGGDVQASQPVAPVASAQSVPTAPVVTPLSPPAMASTPPTPPTPPAAVTPPSSPTSPVKLVDPVVPVAPVTPSGVAPTSSTSSTHPAAPETVPAPSAQPKAEQAPKQKSSKGIDKVRRWFRKLIRPAAGTLGVLLVFGLAGYFVLDAWLTNNVVRKTTTTDMAVRGEATTTEASDETIISEDAITSYTVAAENPRVLIIESLNIRARILPMGITETNVVQAPTNIFDSGWYSDSAKPGQPGMAFIDGHASGATREGLFAYIDTLMSGEIITIERGDGTLLKYAVREVETQKLADVDMLKVLGPRDNIAEGIVLMTCTGKWQADQKTYDERAIVYAERI